MSEAIFGVIGTIIGTIFGFVLSERATRQREERTDEEASWRNSHYVVNQ